jgi:hypothetical protein
MLKLRLIGIRDYAVLEAASASLCQRAQSGCLARSVTIHLPGGLPMGSAKDLDTAKAEFKAAWEALQARTPAGRLAATYKTMNIRDDG